MDPQTIIAKRIAQELTDGMLVNLGIGIPTLVANHVPPGMHIFFQSENGLIGTGPIPQEGLAQARLTDAFAFVDACCDFLRDHPARSSPAA